MQGFGLFDGQYKHIVKASKENKILKWLVKYDSNLIMFHHRFPTSTINVKRAAHPFSTKDYFGDNQYIMVHNGVITNDDELFTEHQEKGIEYQSLLEDLTFNDSEALAWDLALTLEGKQEKLTARGGIAFVCIRLHKGKLDKLYFGRNSSPLNMLRTKDGLALSSEGEGEEIKADTLYTFNYDLKRLTTKKFEIPRWKTYVHEPSEFAGSNRSWEDGNYSWGETWKDEIHRRVYDYEDYDRDGNLITGSGILLPRTASTQMSYTEEELEDMEMHQPSMAEVETLAMNYLVEAEGNFEQAHWSLEIDLDNLLDEEDTPENLEEILLIEAVMQTIDNDPEYINEHSISSTWSAIWQQRTLANV